QGRFCGLVGREEESHETVTPADSGAGGVDAVLPVIVNVTVELTASSGSRVAKKVPEVRQKLSASASKTFAPTAFGPPVANGWPQAWVHSEILTGSAGIMPTTAALQANLTAGTSALSAE